MKKMIIFCNVLVALCGTKVIAQDFDEEAVRKQLDKYIENPKLYYDKIKSLNEKADKANENTLKVSEEYLSLIEKKDSLIKIYKNQVVKAKMVAATSTSTSAPIQAAAPIATVPAKAPAPKQENTPYRVQLAAFFRDDFSKFFGTFTKTIGIEKLNNRNVIEVAGFKDSTEAYEFSQKIQKLGFPGAFVTKYDNSGARQEGYAVGSHTSAKGNNAAIASSTNTSAKNVEYPKWVPLGYQEIVGTKEVATVNAPSTSATTKTTAPAPSMPKISPITAAAKPAVTGTTTAPKALATSANPNSSNSSKPASTPPAGTKITKETRDQLDAAFDQLFKR